VRRVPFALAVLVVALPSRALADDLDLAREEFRSGAALANDAQWGAALAAYERSAKLRPHPWTTYNIAVCERALGFYVRAKATFARALAERSSEADLPETTIAEIARLRTEIDALVAIAEVAVSPPGARVAIDGRVIDLVGASAHVELDPGAHVFVASREGFATAVRNETLRPGERRRIELVITRLPATLSIAADRPRAIVSIDGLDVGPAPVTVQREPGVHQIVVRRPGFVAYSLTTTLAAGERFAVTAKLREETPSLLSRWWFWTAASVVVTGAAVTTWALTRPEPERPPLDGGGLGWAVRAP
jgi:hypothetical protein